MRYFGEGDAKNLEELRGLLFTLEFLQELLVFGALFGGRRHGDFGV